MIICVDGDNERIITIHEQRTGPSFEEILLHDPRGHDFVWGKLQDSIEAANDLIGPYNPGNETGPYFSIYGIDSYVSRHNSRFLGDEQKGVGDVLMSLAAQQAIRLGHAKMWVIGAIGPALPFYGKVGFVASPPPIFEDVQKGRTADILTASLAAARKYSWSV